MKKILKIFSTAAIVAALSSCAALQERFRTKDAFTDPNYLEKSQKMDVKKFFNGDIDGATIVMDSSGKITSSYSSKLNGKWDENKGLLQQNIIYNDGRKDSRTWLITMNSEAGTFDAIAHDIAAPAKGKQVGNALRMMYTLSLPINAESLKKEILFNDVMYLVDEKSVIVISKISGGKSGSAITSYKKTSASKFESKELVKDSKDAKDKDSKDNSDKN